FEFEGQPYMVGALSRMNLNKSSLHKDTKRDLANVLKIFPSNNVFHNNLAQAIEILHCIDRSIELIETAELKTEHIPELKHKITSGVGVIEAPRGTLYYMISMKSDGTIGYGNLVIPTAQNQLMMGRDVKNLVESILDKHRSHVEYELEKLIRAYDPCMSCAAHFLKVKWDEK
ncbi:MAG: nickel-dependent hydrogenase large subunit, partial [Candidatus Aenigmatarchaeota archaeon]